MKRYLIVAADDNGRPKFVGGHPEHSYTRDLAKALRFATREEAERYGLCENEKVRDIEEFLA